MVIAGRRFCSSLLSLVISFGLSCEQAVVLDSVLYFNDFETTDLDNITGGEVTKFNGSKVIGNFFRSGFTLELDGIPDHDYLQITFDLLIHDSWDGNITGEYGPDLWFMHIDGQKVVYTSFANGLCNSAYCPQQTYPENGWRFNNPGTGATRKDLPAWCTHTQFSNNSTLYKIARTVGHTSSKADLRFFDELTHPTNDKCDESWSLDNLKITLLRTN
ncbi:hypothetical protein [uncultured Imperialibacter sp.]|uniref:hypothetical protein n=1 Tax=uncultured Imperialibacter sp. TaxID=1672639 RepID=UPI0030DA4EEC|tara:strand:+ start:96946 stop:97596 length:651 start_codon:yes stop_codon:yes gene_type:complete